LQVIGKGAFGKVLMVRLVGDETRTVYAMKVSSSVNDSTLSADDQPKSA
jgi:hypothetical protein